MKHRTLPAVALSGLVVASVGVAQDAPGPSSRTVQYSPYLAEDYPNRVFFGDTHLHTAYSADAGMVGCTLGPDDAYRFAKGEQVTSSQGLPARLQRPLDFLVVSDHAENLGLAVALAEDSPVLNENDWGRQIAEIYAPKTTDAQIES